MSREATVSGRACTYSAPACVDACVRPSIFGHHCRVVNMKEPVLKVRHDAVNERRGPTLLLRPGYYSGAGRRVVGPTRCVCFSFISQAKTKKNRAESSGTPRTPGRRANFCRDELAWHRYSVTFDKAMVFGCCCLLFDADGKWESACSPHLISVWDEEQ